MYSRDCRTCLHSSPATLRRPDFNERICEVLQAVVPPHRAQTCMAHIQAVTSDEAAALRGACAAHADAFAPRLLTGGESPEAGELQ